MDPEDIEKQISETSRFVQAMEDLAPENPDPDYVIPEESRSFLLPIFNAAVENMKAEDKTKMSGDVVLNVRQYKYYHKIFQLAKDLMERGIVTEIRHGFKRTSRPIEFHFRTKDSLRLEGEDKNTFSEVLGHASSFDFYKRVKDGDVFDGVDFTIMFHDMWIPVSQLGNPITGRNV